MYHHIRYPCYFKRSFLTPNDKLTKSARMKCRRVGRDSLHPTVQQTNEYHSPGRHFSGRARSSNLPIQYSRLYLMTLFLPLYKGW